MCAWLSDWWKPAKSWRIGDDYESRDGRDPKYWIWSIGQKADEKKKEQPLEREGEEKKKAVQLLACVDDDSCLQSKPAWGTSWSCASSTIYCESARSDDMTDCCMLSCAMAGYDMDCAIKPPSLPSKKAEGGGCPEKATSWF